MCLYPFGRQGFIKMRLIISSVKSHYFSNEKIEKIYNWNLRSVEDKLPENLLVFFINGSFSVHQINKDIPMNCKSHTQI